MGILARLRLAKIRTMARPNSPDMPPKRTKKVRLGINITLQEISVILLFVFLYYCSSPEKPRLNDRTFASNIRCCKHMFYCLAASLNFTFKSLYIVRCLAKHCLPFSHRTFHVTNAWFNFTCYHPPSGNPGDKSNPSVPGVGNCLKRSCPGGGGRGKSKTTSCCFRFL